MSSHILKLFGIPNPKQKILQHFGCAGTATKPSFPSPSVMANAPKAGNQAPTGLDHQ